MTRGTPRNALFAVVTLALSACAAGPRYVAPETAPGAWLAGSADAGAVDLEWWTRFDDPQLTALVNAALAGNFDLLAAGARLREAAARRDAARAVFWPSLGLTAGYGWAEQSVNSPRGAAQLIQSGLVPREVEFWNVDAQASWEADLFGGNRRRSEAAAARVAEAGAGHAAVALAVTAEVAAGYLELRGAQDRRRIAERNVELQRQTLEITRRKVEVGLVPELDELRARGQLEATQALLPQIEYGERAAIYRLSVLTGRPPEALLAQLAAPAPLPAAPPGLAVGTRADLLKRRPDVRAAERALAAAVAEVGATQADFFPRLTLAATGGFESDATGTLLSGASRTLGVLPQLSLPVFQGGRLRAQHAAARARADAALADYRQTVLGALADAESALAAVEAERRVVVRLAAASDANAAAAEIAARLYARGLSGFLDLLSAEAQLAASQDAHSQSATRLRLALVRLYRSLGGGWHAAGNLTGAAASQSNMTSPLPAPKLVEAAR